MSLGKFGSLSWSPETLLVNMVNSKLFRAFVMVYELCKEAMESYSAPQDPIDAALEQSLADELELLGWVEPTVFWLVEVLTMIKDRIVAVGRLRFRPGFVRPELQWPGHSAAVHVLKERKDAGYMQLVRVPVDTFDWLVEQVARSSPEWTRHRNSEPRYNLNAALVIAATLAYLGSNCTQPWLQQTFGNTRSPMSRDLKQGRKHLLRALRLVPEAAIVWPSKTDMPWLFNLICQGRDSMPPIPECRVFGWLDGFRSRVLQPGVASDQANEYNGWVGR